MITSVLTSVLSVPWVVKLLAAAGVFLAGWLAAARMKANARAAGVALQQQKDAEEKDRAHAEADRVRAEVAALGSSAVVQRLRDEFGRSE